MHTIFNDSERAALIERIRNVDELRQAAWGKMNAYQMVKHCAIWEAWISGKSQLLYKQTLLGKVFGRMALRSMIKDDKPLAKNVPTLKEFIVKEMSGDFNLNKMKWIEGLENYAVYNNPDFVHDFFGKMTREQIGILAYKHTDHHLRQFGC